MIGPFTSEADVIVGGDFSLSVSYWPEPPRATSKKDLLIQKRLQELGLINCWQTANPGIEPVQTLRWTIDPITPYHCDGIFVPNSWKDRLLRSEVLAGDAWNQLSDHNPVIADFK